MARSKREHTVVDMRRIAEILLRERKARAWSQVTLAAVSGTDISTISRLERGCKEGCTVDALCRLALALAVSPNTMLGWEDGAAPLQPTMA